MLLVGQGNEQAQVYVLQRDRENVSCQKIEGKVMGGKTL